MTTLRDLTADDIAALTGILTKLRPHGAPRWQAAGVRASLAKVAHLNAADVLMAAIRLSQDRSADTPAQIAITSSECWRERVAEPVHRREVLTPAERCSVCSKNATDCETRRADQRGMDPDDPRFDDHRFTPDLKVRQGGAVDELRDIKASSTPANATATQEAS